MAADAFYLTRQDYLRTAQVKLAQAALYLKCADDDERAQAAIEMSRDVQRMRKSEAAEAVK